MLTSGDFWISFPVLSGVLVNNFVWYFKLLIPVFNFEICQYVVNEALFDDFHEILV